MALCEAITSAPPLTPERFPSLELANVFTHTSVSLEYADGSILDTRYMTPQVIDSTNKRVVIYESNGFHPRIEWEWSFEKTGVVEVRTTLTARQPVNLKSIHVLNIDSAFIPGLPHDLIISTLGHETESPCGEMIGRNHPRLEIDNHNPQSRIGSHAPVFPGEVLAHTLSHIRKGDLYVVMGQVAVDQAGYIHYKMENGGTRIIASTAMVRPLDRGEQIQTKPWRFAITSDIATFEEQFFKALAIEGGGKRLGKELIHYWCTWNEIGSSLKPETLIPILAELKTLGVTHLILDDYFETDQIGDNVFSHKFGDFSQICAACEKAGLKIIRWIAAGVASTKSAFYQENPDCFIKTPDGSPLEVKHHWGHSIAALDFSNPKAQELFREQLRLILRQNLAGLKVDFCFLAGALGECYDPKITPEQRVRLMMKIIREELGEDRILMACGVPLPAIVGLADTCRITPDSGSGYRDPHNRFAPSAESTLRSLMARFEVNNCLTIDPDALYLNADLTMAEFRTLAVVMKLMNGVVGISGLPRRFSEAKKKLVEFLWQDVEFACPPKIIKLDEDGLPQLIQVRVREDNGVKELLFEFNPSDNNRWSEWDNLKEIEAHGVIAHLLSHEQYT